MVLYCEMKNYARYSGSPPRQQLTDRERPPANQNLASLNSSTKATSVANPL
jgi:hypothetical protein